MRLRDYTSKLSWYEMKEIFDNFEEFEREGAIGSCALRETAREIQYAITGRHENVVMWMNLVANDCYRIIAERAMKRGLVTPEFFKKD